LKALFDASYLRRATMLTGLHILIDRMKTNPEEFLKDDHVPYEGESFGGKWSDLVNYAWRIATEEERQMLEDARREFYRDDFNERVMKRLAGEEVKQEVSPYIVKGNIASAVLVGGGGSGGTWTDPRAMYGSQAAQQNMATQNSLLSGNGGTGGPSMFGQAQVRQEGATISTDSSFWNGVIASGKGKLW